jgi:polyhydroxyalkanoate synthase
MGNAKVPIDQILSNLAKETAAFQTRTQRASEVLLESMDTGIASTPYDVVYEEDRVKLKHYRTPGDIQLKTPLLVVYALINRETMLDLQPGRSVVQTFLDSGIDLYMVDWGYPSRKDRFLTIDDHVNGYMDNIIDYIREQHGVQKLNLMGICMGGTFSIIYAALHPQKIKNLVTTVTPSNFDTDKGLLHLWTQKLDADKIADTYGNLAGDFLNFGFLLLNPARLMIDKYIGFLDQMDNKSFIENFVRMEKWIFDSPDLPGETFRQFIKDCYQQNLLIQNKMTVGGRSVDLKKISMPLLNIYAKYDHLVPPEACELLTKSVGTKDATDVCLNTGHIGIYVSSKTQQEFAPRIADWLKQREKGKKVQRSRATKKASAKPKTKRRPSPPKKTTKK